MVGGLGWTEILIIGAVVLIFLGGGKQLPKFARSLGEALNEFKNVRSGDQSDESEEITSGDIDQPQDETE